MNMTAIRQWKRRAEMLAELAPHPRLLAVRLRDASPDGYRVLKQVSNVRTIIDVGAHRGQFTKAATLAWPDAEVFAFEPVPEVFARLAQRFQENPHVHPVNLALGDDQDTLTFYWHRYSQSSSALAMAPHHREVRPWSADSKEIEVAQERLDDLNLPLQPNVFLKIDVQGYEDRVIQGGQRTIDEASFVLVEVSYAQLYEGQANANDVGKSLEMLGFMRTGVGGQFRFNGELLQEDILWARRGLAPGA